ncbi:MAG: hypothetical protein HOI55_11285 [Candidatus Marinimicrobia bacterium]|jgi:hypothetical protein|nr:hypothetical protein [Candidatus Neomarinimicrobiota bacterium]
MIHGRNTVYNDDSGKLGKLLLNTNTITKRQLSKAIQNQMRGDDRKLGKILVELNYCNYDDIIDVLLDLNRKLINLDDTI